MTSIRELTAPDAAAAGAGELLVEAVEVGCRYGGARSARGGRGVQAVADVSAAVRAGMAVALSGPSGSGKSTLLYLLAGLVEPTEGVVAWPGLGGHPRGRPGVVGMVFQGPSLVPALDVVENAALPLLLAGTGEDEARARAGAALQRLQIGSLGAKLPGELSGGQAQRVALARVLAARPPLILADEPTGQLDHDTAARVMRVLVETAAEIGAALVVATHDAAIAGALAVRWRMRDGHLVANTGTGTGTGDGPPNHGTTEQGAGQR